MKTKPNSKLKFLFVFLFLASCGSNASDIFTTKKNNAEQFLIEKKSPLVLPPDFDELPLPENVNKKTLNQEINSEKNNINVKKLLSEEMGADNSENTSSLSEDLESSIIDKIKK